MARFKRRRQILGYVLTSVFLIVGARYISQDWERVRQLLSISPSWFPVLGLTVVGSLALRAWFLKQLAGELGVTVSARECFCLFAATSMFEIFTLPAAGTAYRGFHLNKICGVSLAGYAAGLAVFAVARLLTWGIPAVGCLVWIAVHGGDIRHSLVLVLLAVLIALTVIWAGQKILHKLAGQQLSRFGQFAEDCLLVMSSTRVRMSAAVAMLGCASAQVLAFYVILRTSGLPVDIIDTTVVAAFHQLSGLLSLTPGGLGVQEVASLSLSPVLGVAMVDMLVALALMRAVRAVITVAVGCPCWCLLAVGNSASQARPSGNQHPDTVTSEVS